MDLTKSLHCLSLLIGFPFSIASGLTRINLSACLDHLWLHLSPGQTAWPASSTLPSFLLPPGISNQTELPGGACHELPLHHLPPAPPHCLSPAVTASWGRDHILLSFLGSARHIWATIRLMNNNNNKPVCPSARPMEQFLTPKLPHPALQKGPQRLTYRGLHT